MRSERTRAFRIPGMGGEEPKQATGSPKLMDSEQRQTVTKEGIQANIRGNEGKWCRKSLHIGRRSHSNFFIFNVHCSQKFKDKEAF
jgi:hypothetical protein